MTATLLQPFYAAIGNGNGAQAAMALGATLFSPEVIDCVRPFGEAFAYDDFEKGGAFLDLLQQGRQQLLTSQDATPVQRQLEDLVATRPWPQLLYFSDALRQASLHPNVFKESEPEILQEISAALSAGDYTPLDQAIAFRLGQQMLLDALSKGGNVVVLTGAGISVESGVPPYRGKGNTLKWKGRPFEELANANTLASNPDLVWDFQQFRREGLAKVEPNPAHYALAELGAALGKNLTVITQNVDGLHTKAGSRNIIELHGNIWELKCSADCGFTTKLETFDPDRGSHCENCNAHLRANVVLFGEKLSDSAWGRALDAIDASSLLIIVGTSGSVAPASSIAARARILAIPILQVDTSKTEATPLARNFIQGKAGEVLPYLLSPNISVERAELINILERVIHLASQYLKASRFDKAILLFKKVCEIAQAGGHWDQLPILGSNLVEPLRQHARRQMGNRDFKQAESSWYLAKAFSPPNDLPQLVTILMEMVECYLLEGEELKGRPATFPTLSMMGALAGRATSCLDEVVKYLPDDASEVIYDLRKRTDKLRKVAMSGLRSGNHWFE